MVAWTLLLGAGAGAGPRGGLVSPVLVWSCLVRDSDCESGSRERRFPNANGTSSSHARTTERTGDNCKLATDKGYMITGNPFRSTKWFSFGSLIAAHLPSTRLKTACCMATSCRFPVSRVAACASASPRH
eukprot:scaffold71849_cov75-Phaeocystis_antarctica.AAC.1